MLPRRGHTRWNAKVSRQVCKDKHVSTGAPGGTPAFFKQSVGGCGVLGVVRVPLPQEFPCPQSLSRTILVVSSLRLREVNLVLGNSLGLFIARPGREG